MPESREKPSQRSWVIEPIYDEVGNVVADVETQVRWRLSQLATVIATIGGVVAVSADREEQERELLDGSRVVEYATTRAIIRWESFSPARRQPREVAEPEPESAEVEGLESPNGAAPEPVGSA